ncbi:hypothetical protein [Phenylobacterium montanum]|uniref:Lipoprotein n=1 Tax=Phenylobacterium montanum TaxID=2823693 RepID=A0A975IVX4_9CAUL|nr:hypothetical protein [Caulobacter sp. S6]QUD89462.1 hypothetical protein KCG34_06165 [Caulobacter sp. S6]
MSHRPFTALVLAGLALSGCKKLSEPAAEERQAAQHGRYAGVGLYGPSKQWTKLISTQQTKDESTAQPIDDQIIIVVQDTVTGEVRACGDLTGYCIGMNPWKKALLAEQIAPLKLNEHVKPDQADVTVELGVKPDKPYKKHDGKTEPPTPQDEAGG